MSDASAEVQKWIDRAVRYRNLAILHGAKAEEFADDYDRKLAGMFAREQRALTAAAEVYRTGAVSSEFMAAMADLPVAARQLAAVARVTPRPI